MTSREYRDFILEQLSPTQGVTCRAMMGEYLIYLRGRLIGGIYDNRFLIKPTKSAKALMPEAPFELPYEGAKEMLLVENIEDRDFMAELFNAVVDELPAPKKKKK